MTQADQKIKETLLQEIENSRMKFNKKMKVMELLDKAFRKYLGVIYLSDTELEENDILSRSM